jgi:hypothetical protein
MRRAEPVAGLGGILLFVSLFLPWYGLESEIALLSHPGASAWDAFTVIDIVLALLALPAIAVPIVSSMASGPAKSIAVAVIASATGWLAVVLVAIRLVNPPGPNELIEPRYGAWLALIGAVIAWVGSWLSLRDESTPGAVAPNIPVRPAPGTA